MRIFQRICSLLLIMLAYCAPASAVEQLVVGVAPHTSARMIFEMYQPLRTHLEKELGTKVTLVTAPNFNDFARRGMARQYDLAITTGHQARLLQTDAGYLPLLTYQADFKAVAIVAVDGPIKKPADLKGQKVLGLSPTSLVTLWGEHWLKENRLKTASAAYISASDSVAQQVLTRDAAVGFISLANYQQLKPQVSSQLRFLAESSSMAGRVYLLHARLTKEQAKIKAALWSFAGTPEGQAYFKTYKLGGYRELKPGELKAMDRYAVEVRQVIKDLAP